MKLELFERLKRLCAVDEDTTAVESFKEPEGMKTVVQADDGAVSATEEKYRAVFLLITKDASVVAVGAVALVAGSQALRHVELAVVQEVAQSIYGAADVQTVYVTAPSLRPPQPSASAASRASLKA